MTNFTARAVRSIEEAQRLIKSEHEYRIKSSLLRDVLKVLEGSGHEDAARKLREVFGEYE